MDFAVSAAESDCGLGMHSEGVATKVFALVGELQARIRGQLPLSASVSR